MVVSLSVFVSLPLVEVVFANLDWTVAFFEVTFTLPLPSPDSLATSFYGLS